MHRNVDVSVSKISASITLVSRGTFTNHFSGCRPTISGPLQKMTKTLNGRLPPEDGSDRPQTWPKRVSDDSPRFIFRHQLFFKSIFFTQKIGFYKSLVLEEQRQFEHHWHTRRQKLLSVVRLFSLCDPWRRGKSGTPCFLAGFRTKHDCNHVVVWQNDNMIM